jgi:hypothetical protein
MPILVQSPTRIEVPGNKIIDEFIGRVNSRDSALSIAHMRSPSGWSEPGQQPEFDEFTLVLRGSLRVESKDGLLDVGADHAVIVRRVEWVRYSTPAPEGAEYIAVCLPAFEPSAAHRDP